MKDIKRIILRNLEKNLNEYYKDSINEFYGQGTRVRIHNLTHSLSTNTILIESVVHLGEIINEDILDTSLVEIIVQDMGKHYFPHKKIKSLVRWES